MNPPVIIVGAGPAGMTAALDLAHYGIPSILLDEDTLHETGSRAIAYHSTALAVWEKLGAAGPMLEKGVAWSCRHTYFHQKEVFTQVFPPPHDGALPTFMNLQQYYVERFLYQRIETEPLIDLRWNHRVTGIIQNKDSVELTVDTPNGSLNLSTLYVLACDGARSTIRHLLSLDFPGHSFEDRFLIADVRADLDLPPEPRFFFNHPAHPGPTVLIHPQPDGVWRIDWQIGDVTDVAREITPEKMDTRIRSFIGDVQYEIVWLSDYRFHQRLLEHLRHGRVFFVGDSAHLVAPFGARGLNSAVQDVENLSWKLVLVLNGGASPSLLETYQAERWAAQRENQRVTIRTMRFMAPSTRWDRLRRGLILRLTPFFPPARKWVDSGKMSVPYIYKNSPLNLPDNPADGSWKNAPLVGEKLADRLLTIWQDGHSDHVRLRSLTGSGFLVLYIAKNEDAAADFLLNAIPPAGKIPCRFAPVLEGFASINPGTVLLLRPDGHLAARRRNPAPAEIPTMVSRIIHPD